MRIVGDTVVHTVKLPQRPSGPLKFDRLGKRLLYRDDGSTRLLKKLAGGCEASTATHEARLALERGS